MAVVRSPLAVQVDGMRDPVKGHRRIPWGLLLHTTGRGVPALAKKRGEQPIEVALRVYRASQNGSNGYMWGGPGYVIDHDGTVYQIAPDDVKTAHAGGSDRKAYLSGDWQQEASDEVVRRWHQQWPGKSNPYHLFPSTSPNDDYIGVEMIPIGSGFGGEPMSPGLLFTQAQHDAAVALAKDVGARHGFPAGWHKTSRLLGHEDVQPMNRDDSRGGWDPGWLREKPYFNFAYVRGMLATSR